MPARSSNQYQKARGSSPRRSWATRANAGAAYRARTSGRLHALTTRFLERNLPVVCPALGVPLVIGQVVGQGGGPYAPTVDRIDNRRGYTADNVVVISKRANCIKSNRTIEEIRCMADAARRGEIEGDQARVFLFYEAVINASLRKAA
jgi:hypothetical protein